jgi:lipoyl(octanoyl) transferase
MADGWLIRPEGLVPYGAAYDLMHELAEERARGDVPDTLILLEHPPVYTAGRRSDPSHLRWTQAQMEASGAQVWTADRGGSVTFHGPGQLVGYPIVDLGRRPDVIGYLRRIEDVVIRACKDVGVELGRDPSATGVWAGDRKVCAIGVRVTRARVTMHGFALNCATDLSWYDAIVPCGLADRGVVSLSDLAGRRVAVDEMAPRVARHFEDVFGVRLRPAPEASGRLTGPVPAT